jgi:hypothetical protein
VQVDLHPNYKAIAADIADADFVTKATSVVSAGWRIARLERTFAPALTMTRRE